MTTMAHEEPTTVVRSTSYSTQISIVLVIAFALSAIHTTYSWVAGIGDPTFTVTTPAAWVFYAVGFGSAFLARSTRRWAQWILATYLVILLGVAIFYYPTTFVPRQQTAFGWFENDVYTALLVLALYLGVQRLRGVDLTARQ